MLPRLDLTAEAAKSYDHAPALVTNESERLYLERRLRGTLTEDWKFTFACAAYNLARMRNLMAAVPPQ